MTEENPQSDQRKQESPKNNSLEERVKQLKIIREILEFDAANQLAKPLYELTEKPTEKPPRDDTLARLEALQQPPKPPEFHKNLIGVAYQLDEEGKEYLIVLTDGVIMKIAAPDSDELLKYFRETFSDKNEIAESNLLRIIKERPTLNLGMHGTLVFRTDDPTLTPEEVSELVSEDWKKAQRMKLELLKRREENITAGLNAIISYHNNPNEEPPSSE